MSRTLTTDDEETRIRRMITTGATTAAMVEWLAERGLHRSSGRRIVAVMRDQILYEALGGRDEPYHWFPLANPPYGHSRVGVFVPSAPAGQQFQPFDYRGRWGALDGRATHWAGMAYAARLIPLNEEEDASAEQ